MLVSSSGQQNGAALIIGLVLLMSLTIIGIGALSTTTLEQRMAGNMGDLNLAFNAAETAGQLFPVQIAPVQQEPNPQNDCTAAAPPCITKGLDINWWDNADESFWTTNGTRYIEDIEGVKTRPRQIVEKDSIVYDDVGVGHKPGRKRTVYYRLTTRGTGASDSTEAVVQQTIAKRYE